MRLEDIPNALVPKVDEMFTESFAIRRVAFADEEHPEWEIYRTFRDDFVYDLTQRFDWKALKPWAECKDVFVDFFKPQFRRYAVAFARHLLSKDFRPATLSVRDMSEASVRFSLARFDGREKIVFDELKIFREEDGRVVTC